MHSFEKEFLERHPIPHSLLRTVRVRGEYEGKETLFKQQVPQALDSLRSTAIIQSTVSSNRIEGIEAPEDRMERIAEHKATPRNRSEQEIAGYRDVLVTIHTNYANVPFTVNTVLQLHRDLYRYTAQQGGRWKLTDSVISETRPDGTQFVRFTPTPAYLTAEAMDRLHTAFREHTERQEIDQLLLIATYILDLLCIHPSTDGNGRMARLLSLLLLYQSGYEVCRYISLERIVEHHREGYYDALYRSSQGWHERKHSLLPWWEYFLGVVILGAYREFERRVGELTSSYGAKTQIVIDALRRLPTVFRYADLARVCPGVSRPTIKAVLRQFTKDGRVRCSKPGRDATWEKIGRWTS